jgi:hypothetical protein
MVQVKYGAIITEMKGKSGGSVFKENYTAKSFQNISKPRQIFTDFNQITKPRFAQLSQMWRELTNAQRIDWNDLATRWTFYNCFGVAYFGTGFQVFMTVNNNLVSVGLAMHPDKAEQAANFVFNNVSGVWSNVFNNCTFTFDNITALGNWYINVFSSYILSVGQFGKCKKLCSILVVPSGNATVNVKWGTGWGNRYKLTPQTQTSKKLMLKFKAVNSVSGQAVIYNSLFLNSPV